MPGNQQIAAVLRRIFTLLRAANETRWAEEVDDALQRILSPWPTTQSAGIDITPNFFGGMGSLQDLVFSEEGGNVPQGSSEGEANEQLRRDMKALSEAIRRR